MKVYHAWCEFNFSGANLTRNSGVYLSYDTALDTLMSTLDPVMLFEDMGSSDWEIEELEIE